MTFSSSTINRIERNAFNSVVFRRIHELVFYRVVFLTLIPGWSNGLDSLQHLIIHGTFIVKASEILLDPIGRKISEFCYASMPDVLELREFFGQMLLPKLHKISVQYAQVSPVDHILDSRSFAGLSEIRQLILINCRIIAIHNGTFDNCGNKLHVLELRNNYLKHIDINTFLFYFKASPYLLQKRLTLTDNPIRCSCDYYEIRNLTVINPSIEFYYPDCHEDSNLPYDPSKCRYLQVLRSRRHCFRNAKFDLFTYPAIELRILENETGKNIYLQSETSSSFKLVVINTKDLIPNLKCILLPNGTTVIPMSRFECISPIITLFYTFNINPALVWPLNYRSIRCKEIEIQKLEINWLSSRNLMIISCLLILWILVSYVILLVNKRCG